MINELQTFLYDNFLATKVLGFKVIDFKNRTLKIYAPLNLNSNNKQTGFGGSLDMLNIITGWSATWILLKEKNILCDVVIRKSSSHFKAPVTSDFTSICVIPSENDLTLFWNQLEKKGKAKLSLQIKLYSNDILSLQTQCEYVFTKLKEQA